MQSCAADNDSLRHISLPPGFAIEVFAEVPEARSLALGDDGTVFVSNRRGGSVYAIIPSDNGRREVLEILAGMDLPNGIAYLEGDLYVAENSRITRYRDVAVRLSDLPNGEVILDDLPAERHHGSRYISFSPAGKLHVSIGAPCNVCEKTGFAAIERMNPDGSEREIFASGVRNSVGHAWHPDTGNLWFTDNGRDMLGDDLPPDELNRANEAGQHFGFPYCHGGDIPDPEFGADRSCSDFTPPAQRLGPHVAGLGLRFYTGTEFPADYRGHIFIAEHGSWNRSKKIGYRVSLVRIESNQAVAYEVFAEGWLQGDTVLGRPVDLLVLDDGSLLISDDHADRVYRVFYKGMH
jgi:glucose/arabinose dehydrogenase